MYLTFFIEFFFISDDWVLAILKQYGAKGRGRRPSFQTKIPCTNKFLVQLWIVKETENKSCREIDELVLNTGLFPKKSWRKMIEKAVTQAQGLPSCSSDLSDLILTDFLNHVHDFDFARHHLQNLGITRSILQDIVNL